jgi:hypothetical protein
MSFYLNCTNSTLFALGSIYDPQEYTALVNYIDINNGVLKVQYNSYNEEEFSMNVQEDPGLYVAYGESVSQKWAVANLTCQEAQLNRTGYACASMKSTCLGVNSALGYVGYSCKCISGFDGNPYITNGCQGTLYLIIILFCAPPNVHNSLRYGDGKINRCSCTFSESDTKTHSRRLRKS